MHTFNCDHKPKPGFKYKDLTLQGGNFCFPYADLQGVNGYWESTTLLTPSLCLFPKSCHGYCMIFVGFIDTSSDKETADLSKIPQTSTLLLRKNSCICLKSFLLIYHRLQRMNKVGRSSLLIQKKDEAALENSFLLCSSASSRSGVTSLKSLETS